MELRQLNYFVKAAEGLNFTDAARQCCVTQSTLSQQIKQLETELETPLFNRQGKRVTLTRAGEAMLPFARQTLHDSHQGRLLLDDMRNVRQGVLRIGGTYGLSSILTQTIQVFHERYSGIAFEILYRKADELIDMLHRQEIDFALSFNLLQHDATIDEVPLFESTLCAVVGDNHPLSRYKRLPVKVLSEYPIAVPFRGMNARTLFDQFVERQQMDIKPTIEINEIYTLLHLIRNSRWIAVVADCTIIGEAGVKAIPFETGNIPMQATLLQLKGVYQSQAVRAFVEALSTV